MLINFSVSTMNVGVPSLLPSTLECFQRSAYRLALERLEENGLPEVNDTYLAGCFTSGNHELCN